MAREYFCAYHGYLKAMELLTDEECGRLFRALLNYSQSGIVPELKGNERFVFPMMQGQVARDAERYTEKCRKRADAANKRWGNDKSQFSQMDAFAYETMQMDANDAKEKEKEKTKEKEKKKEKDKDKENKEKDITSVISKKKYGEFENVLLSDTERKKLDDQLGDICADDYIEKMSAYIAQSGTKYKSHYAAILTWWRKDGKPVERHAKIGIMPPDNRPRVTVDDIFGPEPPLVVYEKRG